LGFAFSSFIEPGRLLDASEWVQGCLAYHDGAVGKVPRQPGSAGGKDDPRPSPGYRIKAACDYVRCELSDVVDQITIEGEHAEQSQLDGFASGRFLVLQRRTQKIAGTAQLGDRHCEVIGTQTERASDETDILETGQLRMEQST
jgi:hypothetical protein